MLGAALVGCARQGSARPTLANSTIHLVWAASWQGVGSASLKFPEFAQPVVAQWEAAHPGVQVRVITGSGSNGSSIGQTGTISSILAGNGPDVFSGCCADWPAFLDASLFLPLEPFIRQNNIDTSIWSKGHLQALTDPLQGILALPLYDGPVVYVYNQGLLDELGLEYPPPTWTYREAAALFQAATGTVAGQHRYGVYLHFAGGSLGAPLGNLTTYLLHGFGGSMTDEARTGCMLGQAPAAAAVQWADALYWEGVAGGGALDLAHTAFVEVGSNALPKELQLWENAFKWSFFPVPRYPAGPASFEATDYYAINAATTRPEAAWVLLRFLAADAYWSRYCMHYLLRTPSMVSLWDEYILTVETVAPLAKGKGLHWFVEAARGWGVANRVFRYQHPEAVGLINTALGRAFARTQSVAAALGSVARAVDAMESSAAREQPVPLAQRMAAERRQKGRLARMFGAAG
jgi:ABC-type glycerol-3-phosphate transport system substrate-binding protein